MRNGDRRPRRRLGAVTRPALDGAPRPNVGGPGRAGDDRDGAGARPARRSSPPARLAARPGHRRAGRRRAARSRRARPADDDPAPARRRPGAAGRLSSRSSPTLDLGPRRGRRSARSASTSASSTSPRSASWSGSLAGGASATTPRRTAIGGGDRGASLAARRLAARTATTPTSSCVSRLRITPVLTAHPTEARRRTRAARAPPGRAPARPARRPRLDAGRGPRGPAPPPRGDHAPVADGRPPGGRVVAARRGPDRARVLRRDAVRRRAARPTAQADAALDGAEGRGRRRSAAAAAAADAEATDAGRTGTRPPLVPAVPPLGLVDRRRPRRQPDGHRRGHRADAPDPRRPRPARLRGGRDAARRRRSPPPSPPDRDRAGPRDAPRPRRRAPARDSTASAPAGASRTSRTASGSGSSPSGSAGRGPT